MTTLAEEMTSNRQAILAELMRRANDELQGTLYAELNEQKVLEARYANVLEVLTDYAAKPDEGMLVQHHLLIFMQRYYVNIDEQNPLTAELVQRREGEIQRSVKMYFEVLKQFTAAEHHSRLDEINNRVREIISEMGQYLSNHLDKLAVRLPVIHMRGIDYDPGSQFDIDPEQWPYR